MEIKQFSSEKDIETALDLFIEVMSEYPYEENWTRKHVTKNSKKK